MMNQIGNSLFEKAKEKFNAPNAKKWTDIQLTPEQWEDAANAQYVEMWKREYERETKIRKNKDRA